jgi:hypothetical protein
MAESHDPPDSAEPPGLPDVPRRVRLYRAQWIGIPVLILIPVLAALGVFGETRAQAEAAVGPIHMQVDYPVRLRDGQRSAIDVRLENRSAAVVDSVSVAFAADYLHHFADVAFSPVPTTPYELTVVGLQPGDSAKLRVEFQGDRPWRSRGRIGLSLDGDTAHVRISTFIFP